MVFCRLRSRAPMNALCSCLSMSRCSLCKTSTHTLPCTLHCRSAMSVPHSCCWNAVLRRTPSTTPAALRYLWLSVRSCTEVTRLLYLTELFLYTDNNWDDIVPLLIEHSSSRVLNIGGRSLLHVCVERRRADWARLVLEHQHHGNTNALDTHGVTPLFLAAKQDSADIVRSGVAGLFHHLMYFVRWSCYVRRARTPTSR